MHKLFSFPAMLCLGLALLTVLTVRGRFNDPDTWWHLKVGEEIVTTGSLPRTDEFSFTTNHHPWIPHEWLSDVFLYSAYRLGGYYGVWLWQWGLGSAVFILVYALCSRYSGNAKLAFLGGLMGWFFGTVSLAARPLLLGHLFLVLELILLHLAASRSRRWLWALPPLFAVWVNCHGSYPLGLLVLGVHAFCPFVELRAGRLVSIRASRGERAQLVTVFSLSAAALMLNPIGWKLMAYPLDLFTRQPENIAFVSEWQPIDVNDARGVGLFAVAGLLGLIFLVRSKTIELRELLLVLLGLGMGLRHARMVFVFGILTAPVLCRLLADTWEGYDHRRDNPLANAFMMGAFVLVMVLGFPRPHQLQRQVRDLNPVGALQFIRSANLSGPMINDYEWGGYLIWAAPERPVFIDGRADIYQWTGVLRQYIRWLKLKEDPQLLLDKFGVQYCLLQKSSPIAVVMAKLPGWQRVYQDHVSVVLTRSPALAQAAVCGQPAGTDLSRTSANAGCP